MLAMNKKVNILIVSSRDIGKKGTIFEKAERLGKTSEPLKDYFKEKNQGELNNYVLLNVDKSDSLTTGSNNPQMLADFALMVFQLLKNDLENDIIKKIRSYHGGIQQGEDLDSNFQKLVDLLDSLSSKLKGKIVDFDNRFETARKAYVPRGKSTFEREDFNDEKYLNKPAVNTDNHPLENKRNPDGTDIPLTLRDRVSLFSIKDDKVEDNYIYAVLTLKKEDDDTNENKWVESLTYAVIEELDLKDDVDINLIIMLHDKDLKSTSSETFKTVRSQEPLRINIENDGKRTILYDTQESGHLKRTLIVFNHPNHFYRELIIQKKDEKKTATKIIKEIEKGTIYSLNEQRLKDVSQQIATFKDGDSLTSIEEKCKEIRIDDTESIKSKYNELMGILNYGIANGPTLIVVNERINELIRYNSSLIYGFTNN